MSEPAVPAEVVETPGAVPEVTVIPPGWSPLTWQGDTKYYRYEAEGQEYIFTFGAPLAVPDAVVAALEALPWSLSHFFSKE